MKGLIIDDICYDEKTSNLAERYRLCSDDAFIIQDDQTWVVVSIELLKK